MITFKIFHRGFAEKHSVQDFMKYESFPTRSVKTQVLDNFPLGSGAVEIFEIGPQISQLQSCKVGILGF